MRLGLNIGSLLLVVQSALASWYEPAWTNYRGAATNFYDPISGTTNIGYAKDIRAADSLAAIYERQCLIGTNSVATNAVRWYRYERADLAAVKAWIGSYCGQFVNSTSYPAGMDAYMTALAFGDSDAPKMWDAASLVSYSGLPTNYLTYTPWRKLLEHSNGWAGVRVLFSNLTVTVARHADLTYTYGYNAWGNVGASGPTGVCDGPYSCDSSAVLTSVVSTAVSAADIVQMRGHSGDCYDDFATGYYFAYAEYFENYSVRPRTAYLRPEASGKSATSDEYYYLYGYDAGGQFDKAACWFSVPSTTATFSTFSPGSWGFITNASGVYYGAGYVADFAVDVGTDCADILDTACSFGDTGTDTDPSPCDPIGDITSWYSLRKAPAIGTWGDSHYRLAVVSVLDWTASLEYK